MYNDDEIKSGTGQQYGAPSSENSTPQPAPAVTPQQTTQQTPPTVQTGGPGAPNGLNIPPAPGAPTYPPQGRAGGPNAYYEPWQEPVRPQGKMPGQEPYSPGIHSGAYYTHQQRPVIMTPPSEKKSKSFWPSFVKAACLVVVCALAAGGTTYGVLKLNGGNTATHQVILGASGSSASSESGQASVSANATTTGSLMSAEDVYSMAVNQVVGVNLKGDTNNIFGQASDSAVSGSGFIISTDGYIVTNYHVISYAVTDGYSLTVKTHDSKSYPAKVVGYDQDNDLAVIKIEATGLSAVSLGTNKNMKVGDQVFAVGNPLGELTYTMTTGIVSALNRQITEEDGSSIDMFQIDAAVNPGNSGGPVYNAKGEVIGIVSAKYSSTGVEGLGFAIPIDDASSIITQLISNGRVTGKPSLGITVSTVTSAAAQYYKMVEGAYVASVQTGSAAAKAGMKVGDIITKVGDTSVTSVETLKQALKNFKAGDSTTIIVNRQGQEQTLKITLDESGVTQTASQSQGISKQSGFGSFQNGNAS